MRAGGLVDAGEVTFRCSQLSPQTLPLDPVRLRGVLGDVEVGANLPAQRLEPVRDPATCWCECESVVLGAACLLGESSALGHGGHVGTVEGEDAVEDVTGFSDVLALGDDTEQVLVAAAGGGYVEAAASRRRRRQRETVVDGVGLVAVFGGGISQVDVVVGVVGGQGDSAASSLTADRQRTVPCDGDDGPRLPVAHPFTGRSFVSLGPTSWAWIHGELVEQPVFEQQPENVAESPSAPSDSAIASCNVAPVVAEAMPRAHVCAAALIGKDLAPPERT